MSSSSVQSQSSQGSGSSSSAQSSSGNQCEWCESTVPDTLTVSLSGVANQDAWLPGNPTGDDQWHCMEGCEDLNTEFEISYIGAADEFVCAWAAAFSIEGWTCYWPNSPDYEGDADSLYVIFGIKSDGDAKLKMFIEETGTGDPDWDNLPSGLENRVGVWDFPLSGDSWDCTDFGSVSGGNIATDSCDVGYATAEVTA